MKEIYDDGSFELTKEKLAKVIKYRAMKKINFMGLVLTAFTVTLTAIAETTSVGALIGDLVNVVGTVIVIATGLIILEIAMEVTTKASAVREVHFRIQTDIVTNKQKSVSDEETNVFSIETAEHGVIDHVDSASFGLSNPDDSVYVIEYSDGRKSVYYYGKNTPPDSTNQTGMNCLTV